MKNLKRNKLYRNHITESLCIRLQLLIAINKVSITFLIMFKSLLSDSV